MAWRRRAQDYAWRLIPAQLLPLCPPRPNEGEAGKSLPAGIRAEYGPVGLG